MDLRPLLRPRHLLVTIVVGLVVGATIAAANSGTDPDVPAALASPVSFPARAVGDRGEYQTWNTRVDTALDPSAWGEPDEVLRFEWGADERHLDHLGRPVTVNVLHTEWRYTVDGTPQVRNETAWLRAGTSQVLATSTPHSLTGLQAGGGILPTASTTSRLDSRTVWFSQADPVLRTSPQDGFAGSGLYGDPCLVVPLQGRSLTLDGAHLPGFESCWMFSAGYQSIQVRLQAVGGQPGEREVLVVSNLFSLVGPEPVGHLWMREGVPYPIRIERADDDGVVLMTRFTAGQQPLATEAATGPALAPLVHAPRQAWGPDEAGVAHPFPLSAAFAAAREQDPAVADLLAAHPQAYVAWAQYDAFADPERDQQRWAFALTDGARTLVREALRTVPATSVGGVPVPVPLAAPGATVEVTPSDWAPYPGLVPLAPADLPPQLPTVASMLRHWQAYAADLGSLQADGNAWGFVLAQDLDGPGGYPGLELWAGNRQSSRGAAFATALPSTDTWTTSQLLWRDHLGAVRVFSEGNSTSSTSEATLPSTAGGGEAPPQSTGGSAANVIDARDGRFQWTPRERTTIGLGALAAAVLWWLAPLAKQGAVGLFSRIRDDELLEHPVRRLVHEIVGERPGIHHQDLVRRLGKGKGGAEHHVRKLVDGGLLVRRSAKGYTCYFLPAHASRAAVAAAPVTKSEVAQGILALRRLEPAITNAELARRLSVRPATIHYHVTRLRDAGLLAGIPAVPGAQAAASAEA